MFFVIAPPDRSYRHGTSPGGDVEHAARRRPVISRVYSGVIDRPGPSAPTSIDARSYATAQATVYLFLEQVVG